MDPIRFSASWGPSFQNLAPEPQAPQNLSQRVYALAKHIFLYIPTLIAERIFRWIILPASFPFVNKKITEAYSKNIAKINANNGSLTGINGAPYSFNSPIPFSIIPLEMKTPDGVLLKGHFFKHKEHKEDTPVLISFHGNAEIYQYGSADNFRNSCTYSQPYSFVYFNQRNVGESGSGTPNDKNLLIDAETVYQCVKEQLQVSENNIHLYGFSLGGAQAARLKALHPETGGSLVVDRTFSSLEAMVKNLFQDGSFFQYIGLKGLKKFGWSLNSEEAIKKIKDPVHIITGRYDQIIRFNARASKSFEEPQTAAQFPNVSLHLIDENHFAPLFWAVNRATLDTMFNIQTPSQIHSEDNIA